MPPGTAFSACDSLKAAAADGTEKDLVSCASPANCSIGGNATVSSCFDADSASAIAAADTVVLFVGLDGTQEARPVQHLSTGILGSFSRALPDSYETFCVLNHQRRLKLPRPTAAPTATRSPYF